MITRKNGQYRSLFRSPFVMLAWMLASGPLCAATIPVIARGDRVDLDEHTVSGKYNLFDFYADWCGPCRNLSPFLEEISADHTTDLIIKKVDVVDWQSAVTQQYRISSIPHLKLFDPEGTLIAEGSASKVLHRLERELGASWPNLGRRFSFPWKGLAGIGIFFGALFLVLALTTSGKKKASQDQMAVTSKRVDRYAKDPRIDPVWFVDAGRQLDGPYSIEDLRAMRLSGYLTRDTPVRRKKDRQSVALADLL